MITYQEAQYTNAAIYKTDVSVLRVFKNKEGQEVKIHTYIIGYYNPSVRIIDLVSHTTYVVCVNLIHKWRDLQFKAVSEQQIF